MDAFGLPSLYDPRLIEDQDEIARRQRLADVLRAKSLSSLNPTSRQIGGVAYAVSPLEGIANMFSGYVAGKMDDETRQQKAAAALRRSEDLKTYADTMGSAVFGPANGGRPAGVSADALSAGGFPQPAAQPGQADNERRRALLVQALTMGDKKTAEVILKDQLERTPEQKNMLAMGLDPQEMGRLKVAGAKKDALLTLSPDQTVFDPVAGAPTYTAPSAPSSQGKMMADLLRGAGVDPASPQGRAAYAGLISKETTHPLPTQVSVSTDRGYAGDIAKGLAAQDVAAIDAGRAATDRAESARRVKDVLAKNPITGTAANWRLSANKALATAGLIDGTQVKNTEDLASLLASGTLDAIKTSGLGSGQGFTDKDRQFLEKAKSGNIEINAGTLKMLADLNERAALASITKANAVIRRLKSNANMGQVGLDLEEIAIPGGRPPLSSFNR